MMNDSLRHPGLVPGSTSVLARHSDVVTRPEVDAGTSLSEAAGGVEGAGITRQARATWNPAKLWLTGINSSVLMLRCAGSVATHQIVSAMSAAVIGSAPA